MSLKVGVLQARLGTPGLPGVPTMTGLPDTLRMHPRTLRVARHHNRLRRLRHPIPTTIMSEMSLLMAHMGMIMRGLRFRRLRGVDQ